MSELSRISDLLNQSFSGGAWHGPALEELLEDVTFEQAAAKPLANAHTIWEIVLHITAWKETVLKRLAGEKADLTTEAENWPDVAEVTKTSWQNTLARLREAHENLRNMLSQDDESSLQKIVPGQNYDTYFMMHGLIHHDLYHAGQIALLKKAIKS